MLDCNTRMSSFKSAISNIISVIWRSSVVSVVSVVSVGPVGRQAQNMLQSMVRSPRTSTAMPKNYITISDLARSLNVKYNTLYAFIRRRGYHLYKLPTTGRTRYVNSIDADQIVDTFMHAEDYAEEVK